MSTFIIFSFEKIETLQFWFKRTWQKIEVALSTRSVSLRHSTSPLASPFYKTNSPSMVSSNRFRNTECHWRVKRSRNTVKHSWSAHPSSRWIRCEGGANPRVLSRAGAEPRHYWKQPSALSRNSNMRISKWHQWHLEFWSQHLWRNLSGRSQENESSIKYKSKTKLELCN